MAEIFEYKKCIVSVVMNFTNHMKEQLNNELYKQITKHLP